MLRLNRHAIWTSVLKILMNIVHEYFMNTYLVLGSIDTGFALLSSRKINIINKIKILTLLLYFNNYIGEKILGEKEKDLVINKSKVDKAESYLGMAGI